MYGKNPRSFIFRTGPQSQYDRGSEAEAEAKSDGEAVESAEKSEPEKEEPAEEEAAENDNL